MITDNDENYLTLEEIRYCLGKREISDIAENFIRGRLKECESKIEEILPKVDKGDEKILLKILRRCQEHLQEIKAKSCPIVINKLAEPGDLFKIARKAVMFKLILIKSILDSLKLPYSTHMQESWLRLWEYSGAVIFSEVEDWMKVLDAGGTGTIFSYYLAAEGCQTYTIDIN